MDLSVERIRRVTVKLRDRERPVITVHRAHLAVTLITLEVGEDGRVTGSITAQGHWVTGSSRKPVSYRMSPSAVPVPLAPFIANMLAAR